MRTIQRGHTIPISKKTCFAKDNKRKRFIVFLYDAQELSGKLIPITRLCQRGYKQVWKESKIKENIPAPNPIEPTSCKRGGFS